MSIELAKVRQLWHLTEPLYAVYYYAPEAFAEAEALGFKSEPRWVSYFPYRAAPLGPVGPAVVSAAFYSFNPAMVERYVADAWSTATPAEVLAARERAIDRTYRTVFGDEAVEGPEFAEAAGLLRRAAEAADVAGRPLAAANQALPWPEPAHLQLWQAANVLREHRGDGHLAALLAAELDGVEALVSFAAIGAASEERFASRGWSDAQWSAARERLVARGLLDPADGTATAAGRALRQEVERRTDELAAAPWEALGAGETDRLVELLGTPWVTALGSGLLPQETTLGIGKV
ncbi:SCO6745 family protein [Streptomyces boninensis]|uniref:SCO6745 family protein n=1 Tax=Streptomyces boninensis TaxID=2039455 RepID=UPI003B216567